MKDVTDENFSQDILSSKGKVLVFFSADWCSYCRVLEPTLKAIEQERGDELTMYYCNVDKTQQHAGAYRLQGVPTIILFKDGEPVGNMVGAQPKEAIDSFLNQHL